ncbi:MAG: tetratricopeptide repeat protein [Woeseia sp.]|nr:tetratricopeptide repeat protein [Woeseia sp.]
MHAERLGMPDDGNNAKNSILSEFRRRKVVQFAAGYAVIAWLLLQVADLVLPAYNAPDWTLQAIITILIVAFPPSLLLAWLYNITPEGVELTRGNRLAGKLPAKFRGRPVRIALALVTTALTGVAVWLVWDTYLEEQRAWLQFVDVDRTPVVAVAPVRNLTGDPTLDWLGDGVSNLVRDRLAQSRHLIVVSRPRWQAIVRDATADDHLARAKAAKIDFVISGEILSAPDGLILTTRITNALSGADIKSEADEELSPQDVLRSVYGISIMTKQALKVPYEEQVDSFAADFAVGNFAAYRAYVSGLKFFLNFDYEEAKQSMRAALELAPDFHVARYRMAMIYWVTGERDRAAEAMQQIPAEAPLNERERGYVEAANAFIRDNDPALAIERYTSLLDRFPYEVEARQYLAEAYFHDYQEDLALQELRILGEQEPENQFVWGSMGAYLTILGRHDEAMAPLQRYLEIAPDEPNAHNLMGDLHREMGQLDEATHHFEQALALEPDFTLAQLGLAEVHSVLGNNAESKKRLQDVIEAASTEVEDRITAAFDLAWILRAERRFAESSGVIVSIADELQAEEIRESMALALQAENAVALGEAQTGLQLIAEAIEKSVRAPTRYLFVRCRIEVERGDYKSAVATINEIRLHALPPDDPDRTEDKAALYFEGLVELRRGRPEEAVRVITRAIMTEGYRYSIYELDLARALRAAGRIDEARAHAAQARTSRDSGNIRLDLEYDRSMAHLLDIDLALTAGDTGVANQLIREYEHRWGGAGLDALRAGPGHPSATYVD